MKICVTGGMGFIGSHTVVELIKDGHEPVIVDNLWNSNVEVLNRIKTLTDKDVKFYELDVRDEKKLDECFKKENFDCVIHFAGLKAVGESMEKPDLYYDVNIGSSNVLVKVMEANNVNNLIFSSSATVYGEPDHLPLKETDPVKTASNPYGQTKIEIEKILIAKCKENSNFNVVLLRYFNPCGAHSSGLLGEDPNGMPNNLIPFVAKVASGKYPFVKVFGNDYNTVDGTGARDYIHVEDLALGHVKALQAIVKNCGLEVYNLGTGKSTTVLQIINAYATCNGIEVPYELVERRPGDVDENYADASKAFYELNWSAKKTVDDMCRDSYNFQKKNPNGYIG